MPVWLRRGWALTITVLMLATALGIGEPAKPPCVRVAVALEDDIDSGKARANDPFRFVTVDAVQLTDGTPVPAGTIGFGLIAIAKHAERAGQGGYVVLEARFLTLPSGQHVPVSIDWSSAKRATATGASLNIPGIVGAIPFAGYILGPYGFLHHGKDVVIPRGAQIPLLLGDDVAAGACRVVPLPTPSPSTAPSASPSPEASAASTPRAPDRVLPTPG
jgi:hypothetical protein